MRDIFRTGRRVFWQVAPTLTMLVIFGLELFGDDRGIKWSWL